MKLNTYQKVALTTVIATLVLIFIGGLVRAAGAGLGCPDWPKCFGMWIPPTSAAELPPGFEPSQFNVFKTWTEYLNRLVGVVIGLLITATFLLSIRYRKQEPAVVYSSSAAFVLVIFQGWLGGQVVLTGLEEWLITLHMLLAVIILNILIFAVFKASSSRIRITIDGGIRRLLFWTGIVLFILTVTQMVLGTQVREAVDIVKNAPNPPPRALWLDNTGRVDEIHRSFSWSLLLFGLVVVYLSRWKTESNLIRDIGTFIFILILFQIAVGAGMYYLGIPPAYQVFHLFGFALLVCLEFLLVLVLGISRVSPGEG